MGALGERDGGLRIAVRPTLVHGLVELGGLVRAAGIEPAGFDAPQAQQRAHQARVQPGIARVRGDGLLQRGDGRLGVVLSGAQRQQRRQRPDDIRVACLQILEQCLHLRVTPGQER